MNEHHGLDPSRIYRVDADRTAWRQVGRDGVVLDLTTSVYFGLNRSAAALWPRLLMGSTYTDFVDALMTDAPELGRQTAVVEVSSFLRAVDAQDLLVAGGSNA